MDVQAYLIRQGWSGPGNPLNPNRRPGAGLGLIRPILLSRNQNNHGVGKKTLDPTNQWWLRGFEEVLRGVAQDGDTRTESESNSPAKRESELYRFFVRGGELAGTIRQKGAANNAAITVTETTEVSETVSTNTPKTKEKGDKDKRKKKRKRSENVLDGDSSKEGQTVREKEEKHKKRKIKKLSSEPEQPPNERVPISIQANDDNVKRKKEKEKKREKKRKKDSKENADKDVNDEKLNGRKGKERRKKEMISTEGYLTPISMEEAERPEQCPTQTIKIQNGRKRKDNDAKVSDTDMSKSRRKNKDRPEKSKKDKSRKKEKG
ncbi:hypothetical protein Egran_04890 [Elaphomyces granulatus]|uniref:G-patch domain-containing protein n=1 Tax=Elaphomyces granulatus TaxID=519963 RepID=A0A232LT44_9EURO|nr:hypothetical protein Egran_04890 [Elaphomyces granulatus]